MYTKKEVTLMLRKRTLTLSGRWFVVLMGGSNTCLTLLAVFTGDAHAFTSRRLLRSLKGKIINERRKFLPNGRATRAKVVVAGQPDGPVIDLDNFELEFGRDVRMARNGAYYVSVEITDGAEAVRAMDEDVVE